MTVEYGNVSVKDGRRSVLLTRLERRIERYSDLLDSEAAENNPVLAELWRCKRDRVMTHHRNTLARLGSSVI